MFFVQMQPNVWVWVFFFCLLQGHPARKSERSALSLAAQLLLCQQPLLIPGLFLHCVVVYYAVLTATPPHPPARSPALHPLLGTVVGRGPRLAHDPYQPLNFVERKVWTASLTFQSQSSLLSSLMLMCLFRELLKAATLITGQLPKTSWNRDVSANWENEEELTWVIRHTWAHGNLFV